MSNVSKILQDFADSLIEELQSTAPTATGKLRRSFEAEVDDDGITIYSEAYARIMDQGINGKERSNGSPFSFKNKMPPPSAFDKWMIVKGIAPRSVKGRFASRKGLQFAIANSVFRKGIKGSFFIERSLAGGIDELPDSLAQAVWQDFLLTIDKNQIK